MTDSVSDPRDAAYEDAGLAHQAREERARRKRFRRRELSLSAREARRLRIRRRGRRAYIRSVYSLPSLATLGNAICGFGAMYIAALDRASADRLTAWFLNYRFLVAAYLVFIAMLFDAIDGRLARFTRHTTDFGGQLDSLADVISFGCAPAFISLQLFRDFSFAEHIATPPVVGRLVWATGALYVSCAAIRLARFNVSNEHGEQHHFSFLGLPSPGAGAVVAGWILMQQDLIGHPQAICHTAAAAMIWALPGLVCVMGLLMVSHIRFPHLVNQYLRGRRSIARLLSVLIIALAIIVVHRYTIGIGSLAYVVFALASSSYLRWRPRSS